MPRNLSSALVGAAVIVAVVVLLRFVPSGAGVGGQMGLAGMCCLAAVLGPVAAVWHAVRRQGAPMLAGPGAGLGAIATALGFGVMFVLNWLLTSDDGAASSAERLERTRQQLEAQGLTGEPLEQALSASAFMQSPWGLVVALVGVALVGAVAGAIAASVLRGRRSDPGEV